MPLQKPSHNEDEYILQQDAVDRHRLAVDKARRMAAEERERLRTLHHMKCPTCGLDLASLFYRGIAIDRCQHCGGTWLSPAALEQLAGRGGDFLSQLVTAFRSGPGPLGPDLL